MTNISKKLKKQPLKLNLGCGNHKITGTINIDAEKACKPDLVHDFTKKALPFKTGSVSEVYFFHCIEHIQKRFHRELLAEIHRVLKDNGVLFISYPEFIKCVHNWQANKGGIKGFWEATIYGRQAYPHDYHVCIMDSTELEILLNEIGFNGIRSVPELSESYNTVTTCFKGIPYASYEELVAKTTAETVLVK